MYTIVVATTPVTLIIFLQKRSVIHLNYNVKGDGEDPQTTLDFLITNRRKYDSKNIMQVSANDALAEFIAGGLLPLSVVDSIKFKKFVETLDARYQVPTQQKTFIKCSREKKVCYT